jgi:Peptidase M15
MTVPVHTLAAQASRPLWEASAQGRARPQTTLLPGVFLLLTALGTSPALASGNEGWANEVIEHERQHAPEPDAGSRPRGRRSAVERLDGFMIDEAQIRPRQHARRHDRTEEYHAARRARTHRKSASKLASLGSSVAPTPPPAVSEPIAELPKAAEAPVAPALPSGQAVASLGAMPPTPPVASQPKLTHAPINWVASPNCLASPLRNVLAEVAALFGAVRVNSTCRSRAHNARVGGASRSYHLTGNAVDFRIAANTAAVSRFLLGKKNVGGFKHYGFGLFHIDTGPRRTWASNRRSRRG